MRLKIIVIALSLLTVLSTAVGLFSFYASLKEAAFAEDHIVSGQHLHDVENAFSLLIEHYKRIAQTMASQKALAAVLENPDTTHMSAANGILDLFNTHMETSVCYLMNRRGTTVASSNRGSTESFVEKNYAFRPYFKTAITGKPGIYAALGVTSGKRGIYFSHPVIQPGDDTPIGVVAVKQDIEMLEKRFMSVQDAAQNRFRHITIITDPNGIIFASDRKALLYQSLWPFEEKGRKGLAASKQFGQGPWPWSGFRKIAADQAVDTDGTQYRIHTDAIGLMPGWQIVHMSDQAAISTRARASFFQAAGYALVVIFIMIGAGTILLNRLAAKEIARRKVTSKQLRESKERYQLIFENSPLGILHYDQKGVIVACNDSLAKIIGTPIERLIGFHMLASMPPGDAREAVASSLKMSESRFSVTYRTVTGNKEIIIRAVLKRIETQDGTVIGGIGIFEDISEAARSQAALESNEERFRQIFNHMGTCVAVYEGVDHGKDFIFKDINPAGATVGKLDREAHIGRSVQEVYPGVHELGLFEVLKRVWQTGQAEHLPLTVYQDQRIAIWIENYVCKLPSGEIIAVYDDITGKKQAEEENRQLTNQLRQLQKIEAIGVLAGGIAHDFNNILFPIIGLTEMLIEDIPKGGPIQKSLREILAGAARARDLVRQILAFSRQADQEVKPVRVQDVLREVLRLVRPSLPATIDIRSRIDDACGLVMADPTQIHQVALNLITNAYHAMAETGGMLEIILEPTALHLSDLADPAMDSGDYVCLAVSDTGYGMSGETLDRIFDPYFTTKDKDKGTGLGLSVVHGIVKSHGGDIQVESTSGQGSIFRVYLPIRASSIHDSENGEIEKTPGGDERILLIDDEPSIVKMMQPMLERLGYRVTARTSSIEALEAFNANPDQFDLLLTDMTMPQMTGLELTKRVKQIRPNIRTVICSGFSEYINEKKAKEIGIHGFVMKPVVKTDLAKAIRKALDAS
ncbi:MAG: response regulator [Desulfobacterales bacterium]|nr:response regulator [Desulfobacterales bacterium]